MHGYIFLSLLIHVPRPQGLSLPVIVFFQNFDRKFMDFSPGLMGLGCVQVTSGWTRDEHPDYTTKVTGVYPQNTETT